MHLLRTLGVPTLDGVGSAGLSTPRKQLALLAYLSRHSRGAATRASLATLFWETREDSKARQSLRQALLELKRILGDGLTLTDDHVTLGEGCVELDATMLERDIAEGRFAVAVDRWQGEFLSDYEDVGGEGFRAWLEAERTSLRRQLGTAFGRLIDSEIAAGSPERAIACAERWTAAQPLSELAHRRLVELLRIAGRPLDALTMHRAFVARLSADLETEPSPAFVALGRELERDVAREPARRSPGSAAIFSPDCVGRANGLAELRVAWEAARSGHAGGVMITGELGIGKTRLGSEFLREIEEHSAVIVLRARGEGAGQPPLAVTRALVNGLAEAPGLIGAPPRALAELAAFSKALARQFPRLPTASGDEQLVGDALGEALGAVAEERTVVIWCDDLAQMDAVSQRIILRATERSRGRILLLATVRTGAETEQVPAELLARPGIRRLPLQPLTEPEISALLATMIEVDAADREMLVPRLFDAAAGNPLHTIELIVALIDDGALELNQQGIWHLASTARSDLPVPATLQEAIVRRLARLTPRARDIADAASSLGRSFDAKAAAELAGLSLEDAEAGLDELVARRFVRAVAHPAGRFEFAHEVVWRTLYGSLDAERREALRLHPARAPHASPSRGRWRRLWPAVAVGATVAAVVLYSALVAPRRNASLDIGRVVVAPLENHTSDPSLDALGHLAADWITDGIAEAGFVRVVNPRSAALSAHDVAASRDNNSSLDAVGALARETGAGRVVWGAYYATGDSISVRMRVTDAATGELLRSFDPVTAPRHDPVAVLGALRQQVLGALALMYDKSGSTFSATIARPPSYAAYQEFEKGYSLHMAFKYAASLAHFRHAMEIDTTFVLPYLWAGDAAAGLNDYALKDSILQVAERHRDRMGPFERLYLDGEEADIVGDWERGLRSTRALQELTGSSDEYMLLAEEALSANHPREALAAYEHVNPRQGWVNGWVGYFTYHTAALHMLGEYRRSLDVAKGSAQQFPATSYALAMEGREYAALGDTAECAAIMSRIRAIVPDPYRPPAWAAAIVINEVRTHGHRDAAMRLAAQSMEWMEHDTTGGELHWTSLLSAMYTGEQWERARVLAERLAVSDTSDIAWTGYLGALASRRGDTASAARASARLAAAEGRYTYGVATLWRARIAAAAGDRARAIALFREAFARGLEMDVSIHNIIDFESLRDDPGYRELLAPKG